MDYSLFNQNELDAIAEHAAAIKDIIRSAQPHHPENGFYFHYEEYNALLRIESCCYREESRRYVESLNEKPE